MTNFYEMQSQQYTTAGYHCLIYFNFMQLVITT